MWRLMPFLFLLYIVAYLDRINVSFAVLQMRDQLHLTDRVYGRAAGMFFAGYFFFQVPSNLVLQRVGVRRWISGLMLVWGVVSCLMILIRGPLSFYTLRFLLGAAEAGFFPGMIVYLKDWFPAGARARAVAWFMTANPLAGVIGSPISGALLGLHGGGLAGWQWLFLMEGLPAIILGAGVSFVLSNSPREASWLSPPERIWLLRALQDENSATGTISKHSLISILTSGNVWILSLIYFGVSTCMYGVTLWLPSVIRSLSSLSDLAIGLIASVPYVATAIAMVLVGLHSDRSGERRWHTALPAFLAVVALVTAAYGRAPFLVITGMSVGLIGAEGMVGPFWAMTTSRVDGGSSAAAAIAVINSIANLGGYFGPYIIGFARTANGGYRGGLVAIAAVLGISGCLALLTGSMPGRDESAPVAPSK
jgi:MFS transporter, ACS family, tartrate transporter